MTADTAPTPGSLATSVATASPVPSTSASPPWSCHARTARKPARRTRRVAVAAATALTLIAAQALTPGAAQAEACPDIQLLFARGTFEAPGVGITGNAFAEALTARLPEKAITISPVNYPASLDFARAGDGVADAYIQVQGIAASCPKTKIVVGGYSQGAAVAGYLTTDSLPAVPFLPDGITGPLPTATAEHITAVVLFGAPSDAILKLLDPQAPALAIGRSFASRTLQLCATGDPICSPGGRDRAAHKAYQDNGMAETAADFVVASMSVEAS